MGGCIVPADKSCAAAGINRTKGWIAGTSLLDTINIDQRHGTLTRARNMVPCAIINGSRTGGQDRISRRVPDKEVGTIRRRVDVERKITNVTRHSFVTG